MSDALPAAATAPGRSRPVLMVVGGGLEHGGGIGRMVGYAVGAWPRDTGPAVAVIDTRGPKFRRVLWPLFFVRGLAQLAAWAPRRPLLHIHLAAHTSTLRKIVFAALGRRLAMQYLLHLHDPAYIGWFETLAGWRQAAIRTMFSRAARVIVMGQDARRTVHEGFGVPLDRIDIVPNAVPGPPADAVARSGSAGPGPPRILFLGQLQPRKGVPELIAALSSPELRSLQWTATLAGGGPDQRAYENQAADGGISDRMEFPGWVNEAGVQALLSSADILVLPSYAEEMAMAILEGMAYGLCIIATPVGAQGEVLVQGESALLVTPGDVDGLANALVCCLKDTGLRARLGAAARQTFEARYDITTYAAKLLAVYSRV